MIAHRVFLFSFFTRGRQAAAQTGQRIQILSTSRGTRPRAGAVVLALLGLLFASARAHKVSFSIIHFLLLEKKPKTNGPMNLMRNKYRV